MGGAQLLEGRDEARRASGRGRRASGAEPVLLSASL